MEIKNKYYIVGLLLVGFIIRVLAFQSGFMFGHDVNLFQFWAQQLHRYGLSQIYSLDIFLDYPPGYLYVLRVLGGIAYFFGWQRMDTAFNFFTFMPAIIADLGIGYIIYRVVAYGRLTRPSAHESADSDDSVPEKGQDLPIGTTIHALKMSALWLLNPAIFLISSVWGQVESVFAIFLLLSLLLLREKKLLASYLLFGIAILVKAQSLFLGPVYLYSAYTYLQDNKAAGEDGVYRITSNAITNLLLSILIAVAVMAMLMMPFAQGFNILPVIQLYTGVVDTYPFATVNAFNFWALMGHNWVRLYVPFLGIPMTAWGIVIVIFLIGGAFVALHRDRVLYGSRHYIFIVGALFTLIYIFSVRMHERYLFPALIFFLIYYAQTREKRGLIMYVALSITFFLNCLQILRWGYHNFDMDIIIDSIPIIAFATVAIGGLLIFMLVKTQWMGEISMAKRNKPDNKWKATLDTANNMKQQGKSSGKSNKPVGEPTISDPPPMKTKDYAFLFTLIIVYSIIAFARLGDRHAPQTSWVPEYGDTVIIDLGETRNIAQMQYRMGAIHDKPFSLLFSNDGEDWRFIQQFNPAFTSVFYWRTVDLYFEARYLQIRADSVGLRLQEVAFRDQYRNLLNIYSVSPGGEALFDEQHLVPLYRSFMNSTYFDEVYHPRTGYEFLHGLTVYEWTHPPMGKNFKAMSIAVFGMTPFGWRFSGTLAGVLMVPLMYAFARLLFKSNNWGLFGAFIFTFDFMHFAQTRLATIDSYVTLFVIAMYFFMYRFIHGVERDSFKKKLVILGLCGISVGLAIASKWQGVYAVLGLPIVFFPALYRLYLRDRKQATQIFYACFGAFVAIPLVIYLLSYIPFVAASGGGGLRTIWNNQVAMYNYHATLVEEHGFSSPWWEWPLILRPIWLYAGNIVDGARGSIASFGNPAVWWLGIFATWYMVFYGITKLTIKEFAIRITSGTNQPIRFFSGFDRDIAFLIVAYLAQFLPWMLITRLTWIYHYFPSVPFVVLIVTWMFKHFVDRKPQRRYFAVGYAVLVIALFALFYPILSGLPISMDFVQTYLQWLPRWTF